MMNEHLPWVVSIPAVELQGGKKATIIVTAPRSTKSFRRLFLEETVCHGVILRSLRIGCPGSIESSREVLDTGPLPGSLFSPRAPSTFDLPIEQGQAIALEIQNITEGNVMVQGALLGTLP